MLFWNSDRREQTRRNRAKAQALVDEHGDAALDHARERMAASQWHIRDLDHWTRVEAHVRKLLRR
jgi:hypothetical protein